MWRCAAATRAGPAGGASSPASWWRGCAAPQPSVPRRVGGVAGWHGAHRRWSRPKPRPPRRGPPGGPLPASGSAGTPTQRTVTHQRRPSRRNVIAFGSPRMGRCRRTLRCPIPHRRNRPRQPDRDANLSCLPTAAIPSGSAAETVDTPDAVPPDSGDRTPRKPSPDAAASPDTPSPPPPAPRARTSRRVVRVRHCSKIRHGPTVPAPRPAPLLQRRVVQLALQPQQRLKSLTLTCRRAHQKTKRPTPTR